MKKAERSWWTEPQFSWRDLMWMYLLIQVMRFIGHVVLEPVGRALGESIVRALS